MTEIPNTCPKCRQEFSLVPGGSPKWTLEYLPSEPITFNIGAGVEYPGRPEAMRHTCPRCMYSFVVDLPL